MYEWSIKILVILMSINAMLMFVFPSVVTFPNDDYLTELNENLTPANADLNKVNYTSGDLSVIDLNQDANNVHITYGSLSSSNDIPWYNSMISSIPKIFKLLGNLLVGWLGIFYYFGVPAALAYVFAVPLLIIQFMGVFFLLSEIVGRLAGIIGFFR